MNRRISAAIFALMLAFAACFLPSCKAEPQFAAPDKFDLASVPEYSGKPYAVVNDNIPFFGKDECKAESFEYYSPLDSLGRCGVTYACIGIDLMPTEERGNIGMVKPTGWQIAKYDFIDGKYLYNRCHLIGYQLSGENANTANLITGTRYMNVQGMLPFENMVADYVREEKAHVMYRVTPIFEGDNLVAAGVLMEALSVEDGGESVCFNVFCYNVQPTVIIDYKNGDNHLESSTNSSKTLYILNTNSKKFHYSHCDSVQEIFDKNKSEYKGNRDDLIAMGYKPCGSCHP